MWAAFVLIGLGGTATLAATSRRGMPAVARAAIAGTAVVILLLGLYLLAAPMRLAGPEPWYERSPWQELILYLMMVVGMLARVVTAAIDERRKILASRKSNRKPPLRIDFWDLVYPMLVSVMTFGAVLAEVGNETSRLAIGILSFQTGFFWQTVMQRPH